MVEEVGELELGDGLSKGKLREPRENGDVLDEDASKGGPWLPLYRVRGQVIKKEVLLTEGS